MKALVSFLLFAFATLTLLGQAQKGVSTDCLSQSDAEIVLGHAATLTESSSIKKNGIRRSRCTYSATSRDSVTQKLGNVYYLFERFEGVDECAKAYHGILTSNDNLPGFTVLKSIGDEALFHTDNTNFALIVARKKNRMLRIKINKLTSTTSLPELKNISAKLINRL